MLLIINKVLVKIYKNHDFMDSVIFSKKGTL